MYRPIVILLAAVLTTSAAHAVKMYKWVDENGVTHFSTRQPPRQNADKTKLQGGKLDQPQPSTESQGLAKIKRKDLQSSAWQKCNSSLCQLVQEFDPGCKTSYCSRAKHFSNACTSAACQTKRLAFERDVQDRLAARKQLREQQAINANTTPTAPTAQNQD